MILKLNSYLSYEVDDDAEICISISDLFDIINEARPRLWNAAQEEGVFNGEKSIYDFGEILDSIVFRCAKESNIELLPCCTDADDDTDANDDICNGAEGSDAKPTDEEGATWLNQK